MPILRAPRASGTRELALPRTRAPSSWERIGEVARRVPGRSENAWYQGEDHHRARDQPRLTRLRRALPPPLAAGRERARGPGRVSPPPRRVRTAPRVSRSRLRIDLGLRHPLPALSRGRRPAPYQAGARPPPAAPPRGGAPRRDALHVDAGAPRSAPHRGERRRARGAGGLQDQGARGAPRRLAPAARRPEGRRAQALRAARHAERSGAAARAAPARGRARR